MQLHVELVLVHVAIQNQLIPRRAFESELFYALHGMLPIFYSDCYLSDVEKSGMVTANIAWPRPTCPINQALDSDSMASQPAFRWHQR
jgi:hypothetical protein